MCGSVGGRERERFDASVLISSSRLLVEGFGEIDPLVSFRVLPVYSMFVLCICA